MITRKTVGIACAVFAIAALPSTARPQGSASAADAGAMVESAYEGYLFTDVDGNPLPFQSDAEIEAFLENAKVASAEKIPVGVTNPQKLLLGQGDVRANAAFKTIDRTEKNVSTKTGGKQQHHREWRDWYGYDIAAYRVDRLLGLYRVPPTVSRKIKRFRGSVAMWVNGVITEKDRQDRGFEPPDIARFNQQKQTLRLFDNLVANEDSNLGNALIDGNWRIWFIDCSRCFGTSKELLYPQAVSHIDREVLQALRDLDLEDAKAALSDYLSRYEIKALMDRRDKLLAHIETLIAANGEEMVLFDSRPPTERAPWAVD